MSIFAVRHKSIDVTSAYIHNRSTLRAKI